MGIVEANCKAGAGNVVCHSARATPPSSLPQFLSEAVVTYLSSALPSFPACLYLASSLSRQWSMPLNLRQFHVQLLLNLILLQQYGFLELQSLLKEICHGSTYVVVYSMLMQTLKRLGQNQFHNAQFTRDSSSDFSCFTTGLDNNWSTNKLRSILRLIDSSL